MTLQPDIKMPRARYYRLYTAKITQNGTSPPIPEILQDNTQRTLEWTRTDVGIYILNVSPLFYTQDVTVNMPQMRNGTAKPQIINGNQIQINTYNSSNILADYVLSTDLIEIRFYNRTRPSYV